MSRTRRRSERGTALLAAFMVSMTVAAFVVSIQSTMLMLVSSGQSSGDRVRATHLAEAGMSEALLELEQDQDGNVGSVGVPVTLGGGEYWVTATAMGSDMISLVSSARVGRQTVSSQIVVEKGEVPVYLRYSVFSQDRLRITDAQVSSFDSSSGTLTTGANARVGSNGDVEIKSNCTVSGDVSVGPSGTLTIDGSTITGQTAVSTTLEEFPAIEVPDVPDSGPLLLSTGSATLSTGSYHFSSLAVENGATMYVEGPATIVVDDFFLSDADVIVDSTNGPVEFYATADVAIQDGATITAPAGSPADVMLFATSDANCSMDLRACTLDGVLYAPQGVVKVDSGAQVRGGVTARQVELTSAGVSGDEALIEEGSGLEMLCWAALSEEKQQLLLQTSGIITMDPGEQYEVKGKRKGQEDQTTTTEPSAGEGGSGPNTSAPNTSDPIFGTGLDSTQPIDSDATALGG